MVVVGIKMIILVTFSEWNDRSKFEFKFKETTKKKQELVELIQKAQKGIKKKNVCCSDTRIKQTINK